jgi:hypothetical protein
MSQSLQDSLAKLPTGLNSGVQTVLPSSYPTGVVAHLLGAAANPGIGGTATYDHIIASGGTYGDQGNQPPNGINRFSGWFNFGKLMNNFGAHGRINPSTGVAHQS